MFWHLREISLRGWKNLGRVCRYYRHWCRYNETLQYDWLMQKSDWLKQKQPPRNPQGRFRVSRVCPFFIFLTKKICWQMRIKWEIDGNGRRKMMETMIGKRGDYRLFTFSKLKILFHNYLSVHPFICHSLIYIFIHPYVRTSVRIYVRSSSSVRLSVRSRSFVRLSVRISVRLRYWTQIKFSLNENLI